MLHHTSMDDQVDPAAVPSPVDDRIESYETDGSTVLYDASNPLAWIESTRAVPLDRAV